MKRGKGRLGRKSQMSTLSTAGWPLPRLPTAPGWISPHRCKYVNMLTWKDVVSCSDLAPTLWRGAKDGGERGEKTAPQLHIRACFGLQHQLLITLPLPPLPRLSHGGPGPPASWASDGTLGARWSRRPSGLDPSGGELQVALILVLRADQNQMQEVCKLQCPALCYTLNYLSIRTHKLLYLSINIFNQQAHNNDHE